MDETMNDFSPHLIEQNHLIKQINSAILKGKLEEAIELSLKNIAEAKMLFNSLMIMQEMKREG